MVKPPTTSPARACWRRRPGDWNRPIWCAFASARQKRRTSLWDALQSAQGELPFAAREGRARHRRTGRRASRDLRRPRNGALRPPELFDALAEWLELSGGRSAGRPALPRPAGAIHARMAAQERNLAAGGVCRVSRLFRAGRRADQSRTGRRRRRAIDDRARRQGSGVRSRLRAAADAARASRWRREPACWNFPKR